MRAVAFASLLVFAGLAFALASDDFWTFPIPPQGTAPVHHPEPTKDLSPASCGICHVKQYQEWSGSLHARAAGAGLLGQLPAFDTETQVDCLNCHAPRSDQQTLFLAADPDKVRFLVGVDCVTCHVRSHRRYGASFKPITPHGPVTGLPLFKDSAFCSPCHQFPEWGERVNGKLLENTLEEWRASRFAAEGIGCQGCHMPNGSHTFRGIHDPEMTRRAVGLKVRRNRDAVEVVVANVGAGHALPTYATPRIRVILLGGGGAKKEHIIQRQLQWDAELGWTEAADTRLLPGQKTSLELKLAPAESAEVILVVDPDALYHDVVYPSLEESIGSDLEPASLALLREAKIKAGRSGFLLYWSRCPPWRGADVVCEVEHR